MAAHEGQTPQSLRDEAIGCLRTHDLPCAESAYAAYVKLRPTDGRGIANLGFVLNGEGKDEAAVEQFEKAIAMGQGAYDLFGSYADSLAKVGRIDDAIAWSYKTLKLVPSLVDVRSNLAKLLVMRQRRHEALAVLAEFDQSLERRGHEPYFEAQRMAIESLAGPEPQAAGTDEVLHLAKVDRQYYAPVSVGESGTHAFVVDTGATSVVLNEMFLASAKVKYAVARNNVTARLADGTVIHARQVLLDRLAIGPIVLDHVDALVCDSCSLLLGENALSRLDMSTTQVQGVDMLTLARRKSI